MENPQTKLRANYKTTEYWEVWDAEIKKLKDYFSSMPVEISFEQVKDHVKQEKA